MLSVMPPPPPLPHISTQPPDYGGRDAKGRWAPGVTGNPKGRPPTAFAQLKKQTREFTELGLWRLVKILEDDAQPGATHVAAIQLMWNYGYGKPVTQVEIGGPGSFEQMDDAELREYTRRQALKLIMAPVIEHE